MKPEEKQRIEQAAKEYCIAQFIDFGDLNELAEGKIIESFKAGASYEHTIAYNQAIEDVIKLCKDNCISPGLLLRYKK